MLTIWQALLDLVESEINRAEKFLPLFNLEFPWKKKTFL